jgi:hypothetical protein
MRDIGFGIVVALAGAIGLAVGWVGTVAAQAPAEKKAQAPPKAPEGYFLVEEDVTLILLDEADEHFQKGREGFLKKDVKAAAQEIREGAAFLRLEAGRATAGGKKALLAAVRDLGKLADGVERGTVAAVKELDAVFARAHQALARHHHLKAAAAWGKNAARHAGQDLKAAAIHLEHAAAWVGKKGEAGVAEAVKGARLVSGKLIEGAGWVPAEVGKGLEAIGKEIEKIGKAIEPAK